MIGAVTRSRLTLGHVRAAATGAAAALCLAACAAGAASSGASGVSGPTSSPSASATKTITVDFAGGVITPTPGRVVVPVGTAVHLVVASDVAEEVHNHYDDR